MMVVILLKGNKTTLNQSEGNLFSSTNVWSFILFMYSYLCGSTNIPKKA